jgi:1,2-dihydroxy-3-keto-5-methylthiopentene dioxygenase
MTELTIYALGAQVIEVAREHEADAIAEALAPLGVTFERWDVLDLPPDATQDGVLAAWDREIEAVKAAGGYTTADVIRLLPGNENAAAMRGKFLEEHIHTEDEVRFFAEGQGAFYLRTDTRVFRLLCTAGDLINVPAGTRHWFDMGPEPHFTAIRLFTDTAGWVGHFTGDTIAAQVPRLDAA